MKEIPEWLNAAWFTTLVGAVIGAVFGGVIGYAISQHQTTRETVAKREELAQVLRDELLRAAGADDVSAAASGEPIFAGTASSATLGRAAAASLQCLSDLEANVRPRLALEAMVMAWPSPQQQPR